MIVRFEMTGYKGASRLQFIIVVGCGGKKQHGVSPAHSAFDLNLNPARRTVPCPPVRRGYGRGLNS